MFKVFYHCCFFSVLSLQQSVVTELSVSMFHSVMSRRNIFILYVTTKKPVIKLALGRHGFRAGRQDKKPPRYAFIASGIQHATCGIVVARRHYS